MTHSFDPLIALAVIAAVAVTDFLYVIWLKEVVAKRAVRAGLVSTLYHFVAAFAIISYTKNWVYVLFSGLGSFIGVYISTRFFSSPDRPEGP